MILLSARRTYTGPAQAMPRVQVSALPPPFKLAGGVGAADAQAALASGASIREGCCPPLTGRAVGGSGGTREQPLASLQVCASALSDPWKTLGVPHTASEAEIKKAHRQLVLQHHPDRRNGCERAQRRFMAIQASLGTC